MPPLRFDGWRPKKRCWRALYRSTLRLRYAQAHTLCSFPRSGDLNISAQVTPTRHARHREREAVKALSAAGARRAPVGHGTTDRLVREALLGGGGRRTGMAHVEWDISGNGKLRCLDPRFQRLHGIDDRPFKKGPKRNPQWLELTVPCRKCRNCLRLRALMWAHRAKWEIEQSERSWFGTLTIRPDVQLHLDWLARKAAAEAWDDFDYMTPDERLIARHRQSNRMITKYVKRLRKAAEARVGGHESVRVLIVMERHTGRYPDGTPRPKFGLPHYHALIHERTEGALCKELLQGMWRHAGFSVWRVVNRELTGKAAWYVSKYLSKEMVARVRASKDYGGHTRQSGGAEGDVAKATLVQANRKVQRETTTLPPDPSVQGGD